LLVVNLFTIDNDILKINIADRMRSTQAFHGSNWEGSPIVGNVPESNVFNFTPDGILAVVVGPDI